jgi:SAM-dependent methyltransferase
MTEARAFDPVWEAKYACGHTQRYPWDAVVSFVFRHAPKDRPRGEVSILEVGCGTGANLWFAAREGFAVAGVDASPSAVAAARARFAAEGLAGDLRVGDFTALPFADASFDLAIDRCALTCAGRSAARFAIAEVRRVLRPGGRFYFNPYSDRHSSAASGHAGADGLTLDIAEGTLVGAGQLCFYGRQQVVDALADWRLVALQHMEYADLLVPGWLNHAEWRAVAERPDA